MRETAAVKGRRYLVEGRLLIRAVTDRHVTAECRGDSGDLYTVGCDPEHWWCSCPHGSTAQWPACGHLVALRLVVLGPLAMGGPGPDGVFVG